MLAAGMRSNPRISVAMATYNGEKYLGEQLASIMMQTLQPCELVISDDGSSDSTVDIVKRFAAEARFRVLVLEPQSRLGYRMNFRRAANHCSGDLIAFADQDDVWRPTKIERLTQAFEEPSVQLAYHNARVFGNDADRLLYDDLIEESAASDILSTPFKLSAGMTQMFRASLCKYDPCWDSGIDHNVSDTILAHDQFYFLIARALGGIRYIREPLIDYRQHEQNASGADEAAGLLRRLHLTLLHFGEQDVRYAASAHSRSELFRCAAEIAESGRFARAANAFADYAKRLRRRAETYNGRTLWHRSLALAQSIGAGDYGSDGVHFDPRSVFRDTWSGVILGKTIDPTITQ